MSKGMFDIVDGMLHETGNCVVLTPLVGLGMAAGSYVTEIILKGDVPGFGSDGAPFPVVMGAMEVPFETAQSVAFRLAFTWEKAEGQPDRNPSLRSCLLNYAHKLAESKVTKAITAAMAAGYAYGFENEGDSGPVTPDAAMECFDPLIEIVAGLTGLAWWTAVYEACGYADLPAPDLSVSPLVTGIIKVAKVNTPEAGDTEGRVLISGIGTSAGAWAFALGAIAGGRAYRDEPALTSADVIRGYGFHPIDAIAIGVVSDLKVDLLSADGECDCPNCRGESADADATAELFNAVLREAGGAS